MIDFINFYLIPGVTLGAIYGLGAVGVSMIFGILRFAHFAHGDLMTVGAYAALAAVWAMGMPALAAIPIAIVVTCAVALAADRLFYKPLRELPTIYTVISSFGVALIFRSAIQLIFGTESQVYFAGFEKPILLFDTFRIATRHAEIIVTTAVIAVALNMFLTHTRTGKSMRAVSDDPELASVAGLDTEKVIRWTWIIGASLAAIGGVFVGLDTDVHTNLGWNLLLPMFAAALLGGIGKPLGALAGGVIIGMAEEMCTYPILGHSLISQLQERDCLRADAGHLGVQAARPVQGEAAVMDIYGLIFYGVGFLTMGGIYAILCLGLNIQWGYGGLFNAGIAGFYAVGAYSAAIITSPQSAHHAGGFDLPVAIGLVVAAVLCGVLGWVIARICVRLKSDYLAMASIGIAEIIRLVVTNEDWLTNGSLGISRIPRPFEGWSTGREAEIVFVSYVWVVVLIVWFVARRLHRSPWGRVLRAIRDNEEAVESIGKDVVRFRAQTFVIGSMFMGVAGALSAHYFKFFSPDATEPILITFLVWVMLIAGGSGNNLGAVAGALIIWAIWSMTEIITSQLPAEWAARSSYVRMLLVGLFLQFVLQRFRRGLFPEKTPPLKVRTKDEQKPG